MEKLPCYQYFRISNHRAVIIQIRNPETLEAVDARDLVPFRALRNVGCKVGSIPYGASVIVTREVAEPMLEHLKELPAIDTVKGGKILAKGPAREPAGGPRCLP